MILAVSGVSVYTVTVDVTATATAIVIVTVTVAVTVSVTMFVAVAVAVAVSPGAKIYSMSLLNLAQEGRFAASIELSKQDRLYRDAIDTAADSKDPKVVEDLLRFFVDVGNSECFSATLYTCYDLVRPDVALELAWRAKMLDFAFPYLVQVVREYTSKVMSLSLSLSLSAYVRAWTCVYLCLSVSGYLFLISPGRQPHRREREEEGGTRAVSLFCGRGRSHLRLPHLLPAWYSSSPICRLYSLNSDTIT
jgi:hypothetical protein